MAAERSTSLTRAIAILDVLGSPPVTNGGGLGVVQIARMVGREKSQVSRTLATLAESGFVTRDPDTLQYRLGWRIFTLAVGAANQQLTALAPLTLRQLVARIGEQAHLSVLQGTNVLTVLSESPTLAIQTSGWPGQVTPLQCTSAGRALLFDHTDDDVHGFLDETEFATSGPNAPQDVADLITRIRAARRRGFAVVDEEFEPGLVGVAAPVRDFRGYTVAALNISAPKFRLGKGLVAAGREVKAAADRLTHTLTSVSE